MGSCVQYVCYSMYRYCTIDITYIKLTYMYNVYTLHVCHARALSVPVC